MASKKESSEERQERPSQTFKGGPLPQDTVVHLMKSGTEFLAAMDTLMPRNVMPPEVKVPGNHEPVAGVVSPTTADGDRSLDTQLRENIHASAPRVLHQDDTRNAVLFDRPTVNLAHRVASQYRYAHPHSPSSLTWEQPTCEALFAPSWAIF